MVFGETAATGQPMSVAAPSLLPPEIFHPVRKFDSKHPLSRSIRLFPSASHAPLILRLFMNGKTIDHDRAIIELYLAIYTADKIRLYIYSRRSTS